MRNWPALCQFLFLEQYKHSSYILTYIIYTLAI